MQIELSTKSRVLTLLCALAIGLGAPMTGLAQSPSSERAQVEVSASDGVWTVLTMAPDGSWGAATESMSNRAIAYAIAECKYKGTGVGCGAYQVWVQRGWIVGIRCGNKNILAGARNLADAELSAHRRENELRSLYVRDMPACRQVVKIDPRGLITVPTETQISSK
jgi:hypothetical protein